MATSPNALASAAGVRVLAEGGTAADAAIAVAAVLAVVYPHMTGVGGDAFFLYYDAASNRVHAYNGSGAAAALADPEFYAARQLDAIPERGPMSALTVPGAVDAWFAMHERFARFEMARLLRPAVDYAMSGAPLAQSVANSLNQERALLESDEGGRSIYCSRRSFAAGDVLKQPALARTLERIGDEGRAWFYEDGGARAIESYCVRVGSPLRAADLAGHRGFYCKPVAAQAFGCESLTTAPNSQGLALLVAQQVYEEFVGGAKAKPVDCSAPFVHAAVEATRLAFEDRDRWVGDPGDPKVLQAPLARLLSRERARTLARRIDANAALPDDEITAAAGGTTYFACVDADGNAASCIQSLYFHFGSCVVVPELGVALQNRGASFSLDPSSLRSLAPRRRPFHTLMASMMLRDGKPWLAYGTMGGEGQPQTCLALSIRIAERGLDPQAAIELPRWRFGRTWGAQFPGVAVEAGMGAACVAGLRARGHRVFVVDDWAEGMGHAGAIVMDRERGVLLGGADPRGDGAALGL